MFSSSSSSNQGALSSSSCSPHSSPPQLVPLHHPQEQHHTSFMSSTATAQVHLSPEQQKEHQAAVLAFSNIATLNHQGILALQESRFQDSIACLTSAVRLFSTQIDLDEKEDIKVFRLWNLQVSQTISLDSDQEQQQRQGMNEEEQEMLFASTSFVDHNTLLLERSVFQLDLMATPTSAALPTHHQDAYEQHIGTLSAVMLYNLAMAHHLNGLTMNSLERSKTTMSSCSSHLLRSLKLYRMAAEAGQRFWSRRNYYDEGSNDITMVMTTLTKQVLLTLHNNKAHIAYQMWDLDTCQHSLQVVQHLLATLSAPSPFYHQAQQQEHHQQLEEEQHGAYFLNIMFAQGHGTRSAPAA